MGSGGDDRDLQLGTEGGDAEGAEGADADL